MLANPASLPSFAGCSKRPSSKAAASYHFIEGVGGMIPTARNVPIPYSNFKGSLVDPRLRASNEHILIVRVPRAGGRPGYPAPFFSILLVLVHDGFKIRPTDHLSIEEDPCSFNECGLPFSQEPFHTLILFIDNPTHFAVDLAGGLL
jgi:hypothetical protein